MFVKYVFFKTNTKVSKIWQMTFIVRCIFCKGSDILMKIQQKFCIVLAYY